MKMKTLQILGNSAFGGGTRLVIDWCKYLVDQGCVVDVLTTDLRSISEFNQIKGVRVRQDVLIPRDIVPWHDIKAVLKLCSMIKKEQYHVIHTYSATPSFIGRLSGFLVGTPVILHHQAGWAVNEASSKFSKVVYQALEALAITISTKSICVSHAVRKQAEQLPLIPKSKLVTICNGIEAERFLNISSNQCRLSLCEEFNIPPETVLIGNTGRLAKQKDNASLIYAVADLINNHPEHTFTLLLAGDGPDRNELVALAKSLEIAENVIFLGFRSDIPELLASIDIFVSPSLWEGLSISLLEAMAAGCPIIASSILPNTELIEDKVNGLLVPEKSPLKIAKAIIYLVNNPDLAKKFAQAAREKVLKDYSMQRMFDETYELYKI